MALFEECLAQGLSPELCKGELLSCQGNGGGDQPEPF